VSAAIAVVSLAWLTAQTSKPSFEVASVRQNLTTLAGGAQIQPGGRFVARNQSVRNLIWWAYGIVDAQLVNAPDWIRSSRYDIEARADDIREAQVRLALQSLLEDRFGLVMRKEQREMSVQEIVRNRDDGRLGSGMIEVPSLQECGAAATKLPQPSRDAVAIRFAQCGAPSPILTQMIYSQIGTMAVDKTGLTGTWWMSVYFAPPRSSTDSSLPSLEAALQEQLGLKLQRARGSVDVFVIESVQEATDN
jgi:uncharacterized protein (TIGR03435 family)